MPLACSAVTNSMLSVSLTVERTVRVTTPSGNDRKRDGRQHHVGEMRAIEGPAGRVLRPDAHRRQHAQFDGEDDDQHDRQPEMRNADADQRDHRHQPVDDARLRIGRGRAQDHRQR